ncbi:MAG TPA: RNA polymerase sigma factor [Cytophagales bacterium]|nr:RNA polymerase sigma factor [Cytophagales bacterium]
MNVTIITAASKGDIKAFKELFDFYLPKMRPIAQRYALTSLEADDILQEAFIKVFHNLKHFKFEGSFDGWLKRIVVNTALAMLKKNKAYQELENLESIAETEIIHDDDNDLKETEVAEILAIISQLPPGYKIVFNLYVMEDYSHKEIAEVLGISEGSSRSQYSKAKKMIKKLLSKQHNASK